MKNSGRWAPTTSHKPTVTSHDIITLFDDRTLDSPVPAITTESQQRIARWLNRPYPDRSPTCSAQLHLRMTPPANPVQLHALHRPRKRTRWIACRGNGMFGPCLVILQDQYLIAVDHQDNRSVEQHWRDCRAQCPANVTLIEHRQHRQAQAVIEAIGRSDDRLLLATVDAPNSYHHIWQALTGVQAGQVISYGQLAELAGYPKAARLVGRAMASNRLGWFVPCHRVVHADGRIGGFTGNPARKRAMLWHESQSVDKP